ncbi:MAG TPA: DMT family transporter [Dongiaceae bacterium]|nr:DMT family transporter [Dongiaceae bacterium]
MVQPAASTPTAAPAAGRTHDRAVAGIVLANLAVLTFTLMDAVIKGVSEQVPTGEIIFFRNLFAFIPLLLYAWLKDGRLTLRTANPWGHVLRGAFGVISMYCFFRSYLEMHLSDAIALGLSGPIFITVLSVPLLKEHVGWRRWSAVIIGFIGVIIMTRPGPGMFDTKAFWPLAAAVLYALAMISIRRLGSREPSSTIVFYFTAFSTLASFLTIPLGWADPSQAWVAPPSFDVLARVFAIGIMGGLAQIFLTNAYQRARASVVAPFDYTALVYGFLLGWVFFSEVPDLFLVVGGLIVVASGVYIIHRETVVARARHRAAPVPPLPTNE